MDFLKKHYEKLILTVVLSGLLGAAGWLLWQVKKVGTDVEKDAKVEEKPAIEEKKEKYDAIIAKLTNSTGLLLESPAHPVFNPWTWLVNTNTGVWKQQKEIGPSKLVVTNQRPLSLVIENEALATADRTNLTLRMTREYLLGPAAKTVRRTVSVNATNKLDDTGGIRVVLREVRDVTGNPEFVVDILLTNELPVAEFVMTKANPFKRLMGYEVDMHYPPEPLPAIPKGLRVGGTFMIAGESYKIIAIKETELTVESASEKRTTVPIKPRTP